MRSEQEQIIHSVTQDSTSLQAASQKASKEISLFREYRTRLIADVVTGKLDVRDAASRIPTDKDGMEPPDGADMVASDEDLRDDDNLDSVGTVTDEIEQ